MFSSIVVVLACAVVLFNPLSNLLSPAGSSLRPIRRTPRPRIDESLLALEGDEPSPIGCPPDAYSVHIFSKAPLVLYVENFLSAEERAHLLDISEPIYEPSTITHDGGDSTHRDATVRDSEVAVVPRTNAVRCVEARARALQGWRDEVWVERLRMQRYGAGGHYSHHFDWSSGRGGWGRVSSIMAWVGDDGGEVRGGGTEFPLLRRPGGDRRWCRFVECDGDDEASGGNEEGREGGNNNNNTGAVFKPVAGNAVFWENFRPDGTSRGFEETWHAGLPVLKGVKVGLNIWSWGRID